MKSYYHMIDVSDKLATKRIAIARGKIYVGEMVFNLIRNQQMLKGDPLRLAEVAAIMGAKNTSNLIPLCHPLALTRVAVEFDVPTSAPVPTIVCRATAETVGQTGVEMEALTAVQVALLTIYDMCKAADRGMVMEQEHPRFGTLRLPNLPFRFSGCDTTVQQVAPDLGQHNAEVAAGLGFSADEIAAMQADGVLFSK